jgi:formylglycine-generating enzyme required for sulfatase activity
MAQYPDGVQYTFEDGVAMILVPASCFQMGMTDAEIEDLVARYPDRVEIMLDNGPQHEQCFDAPFWIDRTEVTQADFARLGGVQAEQSYFSGADRPVEQITWFEARDFCALRGARLPTEAEWEYAARGPESWIYPWGNIWDNDFPIWNSSGTETVGSQSESRSWAGAQDMSGNVSEWTSSQHWPYPYSASDGREEDTGSQADVARAARGNSWSGDDESYLRAAFRYRVSPVDWGNPEGRYSNLGFRCARSS